jgi:hypothetical protein
MTRRRVKDVGILGRTAGGLRRASRSTSPDHTMRPARRPALSATALLTVLLLLGSLASGCAMRIVRGSGELVEVEAPPGLDAIRAIEATHSFAVTVERGDEPAVLVEADDNLHEDVIVEVREEVLHLSVGGGVTLTDVTLRATVVVPALDALDASGAARIELLDGFAGDALRAEASGASTVIAGVDVRALEAKASGASTVQLAGAAETALLEADGASTIDAAGLNAGDAEVVLSGASDADVEVTGVLDARLSGSSTLHYAGTPTTINESVSGASRLRQS